MITNFKFQTIRHSLFIFMLASILFPSANLFAADEENEISVLKNRIYELEKKDIENRVLLTDVKDILTKIQTELGNIQEKLRKQDEILSTIPRRVPRPAESLDIEDTTAGTEVKIENEKLTDGNSSKTGNQNNKHSDNSNKSTAKPQDFGTKDSNITGRQPKTEIKNEEDIEPSSEKTKAYNIGTKYYGAASYDKAMSKFKEFIDKYPDDDLTDNAQYWIGECYLKKGEYLKAIEELQKVIEYYPLGNKVPDAYLKIGYSYLYLKDNVSATQYFNLVRDMFPHTDASVEAEKKMKDLSNR